MNNVKWNTFIFNEDNKGVLIRSKETDYIRGESTEGSNSKVFYVEVLNTTLTVSSYRVKRTKYTVGYLVIEQNK